MTLPLAPQPLRKARSMHPKAPVWYHDSLFGEQDTYFFNTGTHTHAFEKLGSHLREVDGTAGTNFAV